MKIAALTAQDIAEDTAEHGYHNPDLVTVRFAGEDTLFGPFDGPVAADVWAKRQRLSKCYVIAPYHPYGSERQ